MLVEGAELEFRSIDGGFINGKLRRNASSGKYCFYFGPERYCNSWIASKIKIDPEMFGLLVPDYDPVFKNDLWLFDEIEGAVKLYWVIKNAMEEGRSLNSTGLRDNYERKKLRLCMK